VTEAGSSNALQRALYSISRSAKFAGIRRETIRLAIIRGDLPMRLLPGRKRPVITHSHLMTSLASLELVTPEESHPNAEGGRYAG
jgi:hypothetical protein